MTIPPPPPPAPPRTPPLHGSPPRRLVRLTDQEKVGGVAAGLGWYLGVDPVLVRIGFVVLTIATGIGIPAYIAAWILLPAAKSTSPEIQSDPRSADGRSLGLAAVAVVALLVLLGQADLFSGQVLAASLLIGAGVLLFTDGNPLRERVGGWATTVTGPAAPPTPPPPPGAAVPSASVLGVDLTKGPRAVPAVPGAVPHSAYSPYAGAWTRTDTQGQWGRAGRTKRPRSFLGALAVAAWIAVLGLVVLFGAASLDPLTVTALTITVCGVALVVGTFFGRGRGLIVIGVIGTLLLLPLAALPADIPFSAGVGERIDTPVATEDVPDTYELLAGTWTIDLTQLTDRPTEGAPLPVAVNMGVGELVIRVPEDVDVTVTGSMGVGAFEVFGQTEEGTDLQIDAAQGAEGTDGGIAIDLRLLAGDVTVVGVTPGAAVHPRHP